MAGKQHYLPPCRHVQKALQRQLGPGVVEGVASAGPILQVAASVGVDMPITGAVVEVVEGRASIEDMGRMLLARPQKMDGWKIELV